MRKGVTLSEFSFSFFFLTVNLSSAHCSCDTKGKFKHFLRNLRVFTVDLVIVFLIPYHGTNCSVVAAHDEGQTLFPVGLATLGERPMLVIRPTIVVQASTKLRPNRGTQQCFGTISLYTTL